MDKENKMIYESWKKEKQTKFVSLFSISLAALSGIVFYIIHRLYGHIPFFEGKVIFDGMFFKTEQVFIIPSAVLIVCSLIVITMFGFFIAIIIRDIKGNRKLKAGLGYFSFFISILIGFGILLSFKIGWLATMIVAALISILMRFVYRNEDLRSLSYFMSGFLIAFGAGIRFSFGIASMAGILILIPLIILNAIAVRHQSLSVSASYEDDEEDESISASVNYYGDNEDDE